ncbi:hypothetical protein FOA43_000144 [Brettanomyces nanus]|uniref:Uncharacterized protein n=1 Tax=Eeniella nana TaxID=13502 RepID=A0A875RY62_EENNA|nr:uncharacterized protein FOA43_000144 [Brettanomyces nanus]QPG72842.1 hypothetical protein FOA43_000144 [Brettanomyces nanus]
MHTSDVQTIKCTEVPASPQRTLYDEEQPPSQQRILDPPANLELHKGNKSDDGATKNKRPSRSKSPCLSKLKILSRSSSSEFDSNQTRLGSLPAEPLAASEKFVTRDPTVDSSLTRHRSSLRTVTATSTLGAPSNKEAGRHGIKILCLRDSLGSRHLLKRKSLKKAQRKLRAKETYGTQNIQDIEKARGTYAKMSTISYEHPNMNVLPYDYSENTPLSVPSTASSGITKTISQVSNTSSLNESFQLVFDDHLLPGIPSRLPTRSTNNV